MLPKLEAVVFVPHREPEAYRCLMTLQPVLEHDQLGQNDLWLTVRSRVRVLLDTQRSVD